MGSSIFDDHEETRYVFIERHLEETKRTAHVTISVSSIQMTEIREMVN